MGVVRDLREKRKMLKEARRRYQHERHRDLRRWENESQEHFEKRKKKHHKRIRHFKRLKKNLRRKVRVLARKVERKRADKSRLDPKGGGLVTMDGKQVVEWLAYWAQLARDKGLWSGVIVSGYRSPEYSTSLCIRMCGRPSCPGTCAGATSNHTRTGYLAGAIDVSDYGRFEQAMHLLGSPARNSLPYDPVHFSASGN